MTKIIKFKDTEIQLIEKGGECWMTASQVAQALGYTTSSQVSAMYTQHKAEFDESMSHVITVPNRSSAKGKGTIANRYSASGSHKTRLFNRRGAWLIGMFARTNCAAEFRKWVLDALEEKSRAPESRSPQQQLSLPNPIQAITDQRKMDMATVQAVEALLRRIDECIDIVSESNSQWLVGKIRDEAKHQISIIKFGLLDKTSPGIYAKLPSMESVQSLVVEFEKIENSLKKNK